MRSNAPIDDTLHDIADRIEAAQQANANELAGTIKQGGRELHEHSMRIEIERDNADGLDVAEDTDDAIIKAVRDLARWLYRALEAAYEAETDDEEVDDAIRADDWRFDASGDHFPRAPRPPGGIDPMALTRWCAEAGIPPGADLVARLANEALRSRRGIDAVHRLAEPHPGPRKSLARAHIEHGLAGMSRTTFAFVTNVLRDADATPPLPPEKTLAAETAERLGRVPAAAHALLVAGDPAAAADVVAYTDIAHA